MKGAAQLTNIEAATLCERALAGAERGFRAALAEVGERKLTWWQRCWAATDEQLLDEASHVLAYRRSYVMQMLQGLPGGCSDVWITLEAMADLREWAAL